MKVIFSGKVIDGKFHPYKKEQFLSEIKKYEGRELNISLHPFKYNRSKEQNAYLWGVVYDMISKETGETKESLHNNFKDKYLPIVEENADSSSDLTTDQFQEFIRYIRDWAWEFLNLDIPEPNNFTK